MSVVLLVMTDGRDDVLAQTIRSAEERLHGHITRKVIHSDNGQWHVDGLRAFYPGWEVIGGRRLGFGGAINRAWRHVADGTEPFVFHLEDDFVFNRHIDVDELAGVMNAHPHIVQMALRRQPWNEQERAAGGIVQMWPDEYTEVAWRNHRWLEHRLFLTTNPALWRTSRCAQGWPDTAGSERAYSDAVFTDSTLVSAFWGPRHSGEVVTHIGLQRVGRNY
jgi:hypothetical protein